METEWKQMPIVKQQKKVSGTGTFNSSVHKELGNGTEEVTT